LTCSFATRRSFEAAWSSARLDSCRCCSGDWSSLVLECSSSDLEQRQRAELHVYCQQQHVHVPCGGRLLKLLLGLWRLVDRGGIDRLAHLSDERKLPGYSDSRSIDRYNRVLVNSPTSTSYNSYHINSPLFRKLERDHGKHRNLTARTRPQTNHRKASDSAVSMSIRIAPSI
jgi:hypothetical protein